MHEILIRITGTDEEIITQLEEIKERLKKEEEQAETGIYGGDLDSDTGYMFAFYS